MTSSIRFVAQLFPQVTQLDLTGPVQVFSRLPGAWIDLAWHRIEPVPTDAGFSILPTTTFDDAAQADTLLIPGNRATREPLIRHAIEQHHGALPSGSPVVGRGGGDPEEAGAFEDRS